MINHGSENNDETKKSLVDLFVDHAAELEPILDAITGGFSHGYFIGPVVVHRLPRFNKGDDLVFTGRADGQYVFKARIANGVNLVEIKPGDQLDVVATRYGNQGDHGWNLDYYTKPGNEAAPSPYDVYQRFIDNLHRLALLSTRRS